MKNNQTHKNRQKRVRIKMLMQKKYPRLSVFRSNRYIYGQIIDDTKGVTLVSHSSLKSTVKNKMENAKAIGAALAQKAVKKKVTKVVFDRGILKFHGLLKAFADGAKEGGLKF